MTEKFKYAVNIEKDADFERHLEEYEQNQKFLIYSYELNRELIIDTHNHHLCFCSKIWKDMLPSQRIFALNLALIEMAKIFKIKNYDIIAFENTDHNISMNVLDHMNGITINKRALYLENLCPKNILKALFYYTFQRYRKYQCHQFNKATANNLQTAKTLKELNACDCLPLPKTDAKEIEKYLYALQPFNIICEDKMFAYLTDISDSIESYADDNDPEWTTLQKEYKEILEYREKAKEYFKTEYNIDDSQVKNKLFEIIKEKLTNKQNALKEMLGKIKQL